MEYDKNTPNENDIGYNEGNPFDLNILQEFLACTYYLSN